MQRALLFLLIFHQYLFSQISLKDSSATVGYFHFGGGVGLPSGNWEMRYGIMPQFGIELGLKTKKGWTVTGGSSFVFSDKVKNRASIFQDIDTFDGLLIDTNGELVFPDVTAQGWLLHLKCGKTFQNLLWKDANPNSGLFVEAGVQMIRHKIHFQVPQTLPILLGEYLKGYDRLSRSIGPTVNLGYRFFSNKRVLNFTIYSEWCWLMTKNLREFNYDEGFKDTQIKNDILSSFKILWCLPLYQRAPEKFYFY